MTQADPSDIRSEEALLGAILTSPAVAKKAKVESDDFYRESYGKVWAAAVKCANNGGSDPITVAAELERRGQLETIGGRNKLQALAISCPAPGNAGAYAKRIREKAHYRSVRRHALEILAGVEHENEPEIAAALDELGHPIRYVDVASGEIVETCPTCADRETLLEKKEHRERSLLSQISKLEGKAEKKAREHKYWEEIEAVYDWWRLASGHFGIKFTSEEFSQALPRWKENGRGRANPCQAALKAICGIVFDPSTKRRANGSIKRFDEWELCFRSPTKFAEMQDRAPGRPDTEDWKRELVRMIEGNLRVE